MCFQEFKENDLFHILNDVFICNKCFQELIPVFRKFDVNGYNALAIYDYTEVIRKTLYQFKGCFDIELFDIFFARYARELRLMYHGYVMVPIPSSKQDDERREFNHVEEMFKILKLPFIKTIEKTSGVKQANSTLDERKNISKYLKLIDGANLNNKKVLIVDDVYTTGNTMKAAIHLVESLNPKKIKVLVMSKTLPNDLNNE